MNRFVRSSLLIVCAASLSASLALAQPPAPPAGARPPAGPRPAPTNIKAFPKDISGDDLIKKMREFEGALGVQCGFCHAQNPETKRTDFASDANPLKDKARIMITMTDAINTKYLASLGGGKPDVVGCGTCHRGESHPPAFVPKPEAPRPPAGAAPAPPPTGGR